MDKRKAIVIAVVLFLLIGLGTFVFANPSEERLDGNDTGITDNGNNNDVDGENTDGEEETEQPEEEPEEVEKGREEVKAYGGFDKEKYDQYAQNGAMDLGVRRQAETPVERAPERPVEAPTSRISIKEADIPPFLRKIKRDR